MFEVLKLVLLFPPRGTCLEHLLQITSELSCSETLKKSHTIDAIFSVFKRKHADAVLCARCAAFTV